MRSSRTLASIRTRNIPTANTTKCSIIQCQAINHTSATICRIKTIDNPPNICPYTIICLLTTVGVQCRAAPLKKMAPQFQNSHTRIYQENSHTRVQTLELCAMSRKVSEIVISYDLQNFNRVSINLQREEESNCGNICTIYCKMRLTRRSSVGATMPRANSSSNYSSQRR